MVLANAVLPLAMNIGSVVVPLVVVMTFFGVAWGLYGRRSGGIAERPLDAGSNHLPGSGTDRMTSAGTETEGDFTSHGTK